MGPHTPPPSPLPISIYPRKLPRRIADPNPAYSFRGVLASNDNNISLKLARAGTRPRGAYTLDLCPLRELSSIFTDKYCMKYS